jgi:hypothetical protein
MPVGAGGGRGGQRQESTSLINQGVHLCGLPNLCGALRFPHYRLRPSTDPPLSRRTYQAKADGYKYSPAGPRRLAEPTWSSRRSCSTSKRDGARLTPPPTRLLPAVGDLGPRRPVALRTEPTHHCGSAQDRGNAHALGLAATAQPIATVPAQSGGRAPGALLSPEE